MARRDYSPCAKCGHPRCEHYCSYEDINTSSEAYTCAHCSCAYTPEEIAVNAPGFIYVKGVGWDYAENAYKYR